MGLLPAHRERGLRLAWRTLSRRLARWFGPQSVTTSEADFKDLFDNAPVGYHELDLDARITRVNRTELEMLGYTAEEMVGRPPWDFIVEKMAESAVKAKLAGDMPLTPFERTFRRKDGSLLRVLLDDKLLRDASGRIRGLRSTLHDISARKMVEAQLSQERTLLRTLIDNLPDPIFVKDSERRFILANAAFVRFGNQAAESSLIGRTDFEIVPPERAAQYDREDVSVLDGDAIVNREDEAVDASGRRHWTLTTKVPLRDAQGGIVGLIGISRDVTEHKRTSAALREAEERQRTEAVLAEQRRLAEEALRVSERKFRDLFDNAPIAYHELDTDGRITRVNRTELEMLGYSAAEMIGRQAWEFIVEPVAESAVKAKLSRQQPLIPFERTFRRRDGVLVPVVVHDRLILDSEGKVCGIRSTLQDLTARKRDEQKKAELEDQLRQSQKIEAVGRLAGGVAHDFNNLLMVITGHAHLAKSRMSPDDAARRHIEDVQKAADKAALLTHQLLTFSRKQVVEARIVDLGLLVTEAAKMLRRLIPEDVELILSSSPHLGRVKADPAQLEQVVMNLAINARDAMPDGGRITIHTDNFTIDNQEDEMQWSMPSGRYVILTVGDTGVGMDAETRSHVFEPFFTTKAPGKGTGLGLATVYGIVKQTGGSIRVVSEPGQGTTFTILIPTAEGVALEEKAGDSQPLVGGVETILLIEDEEAVRSLVRDVLGKIGYRVLEAAFGEEAIQIARTHRGDIAAVISDVIMPGLSGPDTVRRILSMRPGLKVIYMSGYTDDTILKHRVLEGSAAFLQKPFTVDNLSQKLRELLDIKGA